MLSVALVHDWLNQYGGAERVLEQLVSLFPGAPVYTSMYWRDGMPDTYRSWDIRTTWMDRLPGVYRRHQWYFPLYALAFATLKMREGAKARPYQLVISNKSGFCHGTPTGDIPHLCYCLAPTRYVWEFDAYAARESLPAWLKMLLNPVITLLRRWDYRAAQRATLHFVAISREIQARIRDYYGRESTIIYPPVDVTRYRPSTQVEDYYLLVSRLIPYKRIDLAIRACNALKLPLYIVGSGRDQPALEAMAGPTVKFLGRVPDMQLPDLLARCKAFIFPGREDFGIAPLEAQASGRPVIAFGAGGALDSVVAGETGAFFYEPTPESLSQVLMAFDAQSVDPAVCRANAERFSVQGFRREILETAERIANQRICE
ncbi:MAG: glycosyltransferase [Anaerolineae bacterium]|nr:glycosyltransferase [Anaerolineae bacterium]